MKKLVLLPLLVLVSASARAGGASGPTSWLGQKVDPAQSSFCRAHGCVLQEVRQNDDNREGWHDGILRTYRLTNGAKLEVEVRPAGWVSTARLRLPGQKLAGGIFATQLQHYALAAQFLSVVTGRPFLPAAIAKCQQAGVALGLNDNYGPPEPLSRWKTPGGLPFVARCGINSQVGVWAGWMQA